MPTSVQSPRILTAAYFHGAVKMELVDRGQEPQRQCSDPLDLCPTPADCMWYTASGGLLSKRLQCL